MTNRAYAAPRLDRLVEHSYTAASTARDPYGAPLPGPRVTRRVWCSYRPFTSRQQLQVGDSGLISLQDARFIVRADGAWSTGDTFTFQGGSWTVEGIAEIVGRERFLELVARAIT